MKLIVGLGNPGKEYNNTRHNIGFEFIDYYLEKNNINESWSKKFDGLYIQTSIGREKVIFLKPQTYMNLSGNSVSKICHYFNIDISDILIVCDDLDLNVGNFKLRANGSCGGHNGLRDIEAKLGSPEYKRLKIGISNNKNFDTKDYVLGRLSKDEIEKLTEVQNTILSILDDYFKVSFTELMAKYNHR